MKENDNEKIETKLKTLDKILSQEKAKVTNQKPKEKSLLIIFAVSTIIMSVITGFFAWQNQKLTKSLSEQITKNQPTPSPIATQTPNVNTTDWKTYENKDISLTFKYPSVVKITEKAEGCINIQLEIAHINIKPPESPLGGCVITGLDSEYQLKNSQEDIYMNGKIYNFSVTSASISTRTTIFSNLKDVPKEGFIIEFGGSFKPERESDYLKEENTIKEILSTFQFQINTKLD